VRVLVRRVAALAVLLLAASAQPTLAAGGGHHLAGGGTASISQVAMNVDFAASGSVSGSFECLMAGRSAFVLPPFGLAHSMIVHATPTAGSVSGTKATFTGPGSLTLDGRVKMDIHVSVQVDVAAQTFELTVVEVGSMGLETMQSGHLTMN
jgi:hypothetical protein